MTDEALEDPWNDRIEDVKGRFGAPPVLALISFVLAVLSLAGFGLMNGTTYVVPFLNDQPQHDRLVVGVLIGAALALVPVALGWRSANIQTDLPWASVLAKAAVILGLGSFVLRLVVAIVQATQDGPTGFSRL
jgi:hypothetical protein